MEENFGKLGIQDFFNVLFNGALFIVCAYWIFPKILDRYFDLKKQNETEAYAILLVVFFAIGLIIQEFAQICDRHIFHIKMNAERNFLKKKYKNVCIGGRSKNHIIGNNNKLKRYRKMGKKILKEKGFKFSNEFTGAQSTYIYAVCYYTVENCGRSSKYEKMRGLFDMSVSLSFSCMVLEFLSIISGLLCLWDYEIKLSMIIQILVFGVGIVIFNNRAKVIMNYKVRMLMETYCCCKENAKKKNA